MQIVRIEFAVWRWAASDCDEGERPGLYAQRRRSNGTWNRAVRFASKEARSAWIDREISKVLEDGGYDAAVSTISEHSA